MKEQVLDRSDASTNAARTSGGGMNRKFWRRGAMLSVAASLSGAGLILGMGVAQAAAIVTVQSPTSVYTSTSVSSGQVGIPELQPGDSVVVVCWTPRPEPPFRAGDGCAAAPPPPGSPGVPCDAVTPTWWLAGAAPVDGSEPSIS